MWPFFNDFMNDKETFLATVSFGLALLFVIGAITFGIKTDSL